MLLRSLEGKPNRRKLRAFARGAIIASVTGTVRTTGTNQERGRPLILLVEDQLDLRRLYAEQLGLSGFDVSEAGDGATAVANALELGPDVVLMDLSLPGIDGWEATRRLKADPRTASIPVVALTAHDGAGELERATRAGCDWFIPKPCPPPALIVEVRRVLSGDYGTRTRSARGRMQARIDVPPSQGSPSA